MLLLAQLDPPTPFEDWALRIVVFATMVAAFVTAVRAYRNRNRR